LTKSNRRNKQQPPATIAPDTFLQVQHQQFSGILPHPDLFVGYNRGVPDAAERILVMAEEWQRHDIASDEEIVGAQVHDVRERWKFAHSGRLFAFVIVVIIVLLYFAILGLTVWFNNTTMFGVIAGAGVIASLPSLVRSFQKKQEKS
jgi:uncharacterized membrane protein